MGKLDVMDPPVLEPVLRKPVRHANPLWDFLGFIARSIPTLLVLAGAGAVGWWGHNTGWKVPKFSELSGVVPEKDDWCREHNVPETVCIECDATRLPKAKSHGWCKLHGVAECVLCHPELAQLPVPPVVTSRDLERSKRSLDFAPRPTNTSNCMKHNRRIQYASAKDADKAGVAVEPVWTAPAVEFVAAPGEIGFDQTRVAHMSTRSPGTVWKVYKHLGDQVKAGEVLALVDATEVGKAKAELLQSLATLQLKEHTLATMKDSDGVVAAVRVREMAAAVREAEVRVGAACQALTNLGLPIQAAEVRTLTVDQLQNRLHLLGIPDTIAATLYKVATTNLLPIFAPIDGRVMSREVVAGEVVDSARILFELVDTRYLWLTLDVKGEEAPRVSVGQTVRFRPDNGQGELVGKLVWRDSRADLKTRTVKVRVELFDPELKLVSNTFGSGKIILREEEEVISVPNDAVQWDGCCHIVFVRDKDYLKADAPKVFHVRKVRIGARDGKNTEIVAGVLLGELVVTKGSGLMLTELLRGELGEGCACCHPK